MSEGLKGVLTAWEDFRLEPDEYRELADERILVLFHRSGRGKTSRLKLEKMHSEGRVWFKSKAEK
jgi:hypothetical protein